jgi:hypothetical protein
MVTQWAGYNIECRMGTSTYYVPRYIGDETGLPTTIASGSGGGFVALTAPTPAMLASGSTTLIYWQGGGQGVGMVRAIDGNLVPDSVLPQTGTEIAPGMYSMGVVSEQPVNSVMVEMVPLIGVIPLIAYLIVIAIIMVAATVILVSKYWTSAWVYQNQVRADEAYQDYLLKCQKVVSDVNSDCDGLPGDDIRTVTWANGKVIQFAISDAGMVCLGGATSNVVDPGTTADPPRDPIDCDGIGVPFTDICIPWLAIYATAGFIILVTLGPSLIGLMKGKSSD